MKLCARLAENKRIENLLKTAEDAFNFKCKQMKEFQVTVQRISKEGNWRVFKWLKRN